MSRAVKRAFKYRFYPTDEQAAQLSRTFGCVRLRPSGDAHGQLGAGDDVALGADLDPPVAADKAYGRDRQRPVPRPGERGCGDGA